MHNLNTVLVFAAFISAAASAEQTSCIVGVTIIDVVDGSRAQERNVVIEGERIASVTGAALATPDCTNLIEAEGKYLIPGLWDMHVHGTSRDSLWPIYIANGVTGVRDMFGPSDFNALRQRLADAQIKPRVYMSGPLIDGPPGIWPGSTLVVNADDARRVVTEQAAAGVDFLKVYQLLSRDAYYAIIDEASKRGLPVVGHVPSSVSAWEAANAGQLSIEHLIDIAVSCSADEDTIRQRPPESYMDSRKEDAGAVSSFDSTKCGRLAQVFLRNGTWMVPTLIAFHAESHVDQDKGLENERLQYFNAEVRNWLEADQELMDADVTALKAALRGDMGLVSFLYSEGVPFLAGTDALNPYVFPGFSLHDELALLVESGLTPLAAIQAATINAAKFLGTDGELGSVEPGKLADLLLLDANPLEDIQNSTKIAGVFSNGHYFDKLAIEGLLASARRSAAGIAEH